MTLELLRDEGSPCAGCGTETTPKGTVDWDGTWEWYMLRGEVWAAAGMGRQGFLCIGCVERRIGRRLTREDFTDAPVNCWPSPLNTDRLNERLGFA